jgi:hypothetical protein
MGQSGARCFVIIFLYRVPRIIQFESQIAAQSEAWLK